MAGGGKETPRQKMIGMMYLVLTALLALQVSNAVLDKFVFIDESLQHSVDVTRHNSDLLLKGMTALAEKQGNSPKDMALIKKAQEAKTLTTELLAELDASRKLIVDATGGKEENGTYKGAKDYDVLMNLLIGPEGGPKGKFYDVEKKMDTYAETMQKQYGLEVGDFTPAAKDIEQFKNNPDQKDKDFVELNFDHTPLVAALAVINEMKSRITQIENKAIAEIQKKMGEVPIKFDQIQAIAIPTSSVVAAGMEYEAKIMLAAGASNVTPSIRTDAGSVKVEGGHGILKFKASGGGYVDGKAKKKWKGFVTIKTASGTDTTFTVEQEYTVVEPVIKVKTDVGVSLYLNCCNQLEIDVPALGTTYDPAFKATGATVLKGSSKSPGGIVVVPTQQNVAIEVSSGGSIIGTEKFHAKPIPKPEIVFAGDGKPLDLKTGGRMPRSVQAKAVPDKNFAETNPKDARYSVQKWKITLARGRRPMGMLDVSGASANVTEMASKAKDGDRLVIEVPKGGVMRQGCQSQEAVNVEALVTYPISE